MVSLRKPKKDGYTSKKPEGAKLFNDTFEAKTWKELLIAVSEKLLRYNPEAFDKLSDSEIMKGKTQLKTDEGILQPKEVADLMVDIVLDEKENPPGVYVVTVPEGTKKIERLPFSQFRSRICHT